MLYLLDSVAKNLRAVYAPLFERNLPEIYIRALEAAPSPGVRTSLEHLRATWKDVFPAVRPPSRRRAASRLSRLEAKGRASSKRQTRQTPRVPASDPTRERGTHRRVRPSVMLPLAPPETPCPHDDGALIVAAPLCFATLQAHAAIDRHLAQLAAAPPPQPMAAPWGPPPPEWGGAAAPPPWQQQPPPGWYGGAPPPGYGAPQQLPPPGMQFMPQQQQFAPPPGYGGAYGGMQPQMMMVMAPQGGYPGPYPGGPDPGMGGMMYGHAMPPGAPMGFAPPPQQQQQLQPLVGSVQQQWLPPQMGPPAPPPPAAPPAGGSALASLLQGLAAGIVSGQLSGAPPGAAPPPPLPSIGTEFTAEALRAPPAAPLRVLYDPEALQCAATGRRFTDRGVYSAHLDLQYLQKRREKEGKSQSRRWFVPLDAWIAGGAAPATDDGPSPFGDAPGGGAAEPPGPPPSVAVDDAQPTCALTGETFETFWNAELEEWHYRGAVRLDRPVGGVPAGRLVLAKAVPREGDLAYAALRVADSRALAADLAAAAASADEPPLPPPYVEPVAPQVEPPPEAAEAAADGVKDAPPPKEEGAEGEDAEPSAKRLRKTEDA